MTSTVIRTATTRYSHIHVAKANNTLLWPRYTRWRLFSLDIQWGADKVFFTRSQTNKCDPGQERFPLSSVNADRPRPLSEIIVYRYEWLVRRFNINISNSLSGSLRAHTHFLPDPVRQRRTQRIDCCNLSAPDTFETHPRSFDPVWKKSLCARSFLDVVCQSIDIFTMWMRLDAVQECQWLRGIILCTGDP